MKHLRAMDDIHENKVLDAKQKNLNQKMKSMQIFEDKIMKELEYSEASSQLKMRDNKAKYERAVMKIVFELKKKNAINEKKRFKEDKETRVKETTNVMGSIENFYRDRIHI